MKNDSTPDRKLLALAPDPNIPQGLGIQFFQKLRIAVCAGYWLPNETLPSAQQMGEQLGLQQADVELALELLCSDNWLRRNTDGFEITPKIDQPVSKLVSLSDMLRSRGFTPGSRWIKRELSAPTLDEAWRLNLQNNTQVARLSRVRTANDELIGFEISTLPSQFLPDPIAVGTSLYEYMSRHQLEIARATEEIDAVICSAEQSARYGLPAGQSLLRLIRLSYTPTGRAMELTYSYFHSDYYHYVVELAD
ncbi:GntR family transcriptional regulator [Chitinibacteraceae bacterium HSL-7]